MNTRKTTIRDRSQTK